jgi:cytochrome bd-type quinol oxidase subunit 2
VKGRGFAKASFVAALTGALLAAFAPTYTSCESQAGGTCGHTTGLAVNGSWILVVASVPVVLALLAVLMPRRGTRIVTAVLLWACCAIAVASIGLFFVPAAILMTIAAFRRDRELTQLAGAPSRPS